MTEFGYALSSEEHPPADLVANARAAEEAGFTFALISDHFHPWIDRQGHSPFVWSVLGAIAQATDHLRVGTGVTCPTIRIHPAIVAQAAATTAALMPDRFFLGLGTGENLNEHVVGRGWPSLDVRTEMLEEAVEIIRELWTGDLTSHRGTPFHGRERSRLYASRAAPADLPRCRRAGGSRARRSDRGRPHRNGAGGRARGGLPLGRRRRTAVRTGHDLLGPLGAGREKDRSRVVADRRDPRRSEPGASAAGPFRGPHVVGDRGPGRRVGVMWA